MKCRVLGLARSTQSRKLKKPDDTELEQDIMKVLKNKEHRGIDWVYMKLRHDGYTWNRKEVLRVYRKLRLTLKLKNRKRIPPRTKSPLLQPEDPNTAWSMDFMSDALSDGRKIRILTVIDDFNRECITSQVGISMPSERVCGILDQIIEQRRKPKVIRTDNGPEFTRHYYKNCIYNIPSRSLVDRVLCVGFLNAWWWNGSRISIGVETKRLAESSDIR